MPHGICVYVEHAGGVLDPSAAELASAAAEIRAATGEAVQALVVVQNVDALPARLEQLPVDEIHVLPTERDVSFQDDAVAKALAQALRTIDPSAMLLPATTEGKSIFSRVAAILGSGLTADCTGIDVGKREDGSFYLKQNKPSYGDNVMVTIVTKAGVFPQMLTVRPGVFLPQEAACPGNPPVKVLHGIELPPSPIQVLEVTDIDGGSTTGLMAAEVVVVGGRGALEGNHMELLRAFADRIGGTVAGTRPLADTEVIPFENQIGQTGCTIRPKICLSFGVSGAIQHVEGIKDTKLYIAVNTDENAPIYRHADYGVARDMGAILQSCLVLKSNCKYDYPSS